MVPLISIVLLAGVSLIMGGIVPAVFQRFRVEPQELARERPYIERNIDATRKSFNLGAGRRPSRSRPATTSPPQGPPGQPADAGATSACGTPRCCGRASATSRRSPSTTTSPTSTWTATRSTAQTAPGDDLGPRGRPQPAGRRRPGPGRTCTWPTPTATAWWRSRSTPPSRAASPTSSSRGSTPRTPPSRSTEPRVYFGEPPPNAPQFVVANTAQREYDALLAQRRERHQPVQLQRPARAAQLSDIGLAGWPSPSALPRHQPADLRQHQERPAADVQPRHPREVREGGPVPCSRTSDPYAVVVDGSIKYRARRLHHHQQLPVRPAHRPGRRRPPQRDRQPRAEAIGNYIRNSVKAVVDAYTGEVYLPA